MSEYWTITIGEILAEESIACTSEQLERIGRALAGAASVETEYSGIAAQTKPGAPQKSPERQRIARLEECIQRLSRRFGVGIDPDRMEINYMTPVGTSHYGTHREDLR